MQWFSALGCTTGVLLRISVLLLCTRIVSGLESVKDLGSSAPSPVKCGQDGNPCTAVPDQVIESRETGPDGSRKRDVTEAKVSSDQRGKDHNVAMKSSGSFPDLSEFGIKPGPLFDTTFPYTTKFVLNEKSGLYETMKGDSDDDILYEDHMCIPYDPLTPCVRCDFLPMEFLECDPPIDLQGNMTAFEELKHGCYKYGGQRWEDVQNTSAFCSVLPGIECFGKRRFLRDGFPCVKFTGHYFLSTLLFSVLMGFLGLDRFCLGHTCIAVGKLLSLGALGVWWIVDIVLLVTGHLVPEDGSNWMPSY